MENIPQDNRIPEETIRIPRVEYEALKTQNAELAQQLKWLMEQMRLARWKRFGASSEKSKYDQFNLFNEAEATADQRVAEPELTEIQTRACELSAEGKRK